MAIVITGVIISWHKFEPTKCQHGEGSDFQAQAPFDQRLLVSSCQHFLWRSIFGLESRIELFWIGPEHMVVQSGSRVVFFSLSARNYEEIHSSNRRSLEVVTGDGTFRFSGICVAESWIPQFWEQHGSGDDTFQSAGSRDDNSRDCDLQGQTDIHPVSGYRYFVCRSDTSIERVET